MKRLTECWFEFSGVCCESMGVQLMDIPRRPIPAMQGQKIEIDGRSGFLWQEMRGAYKLIRIEAKCSTLDGFSASALTQWLAEGGLLRFSDEPDRAYEAHVTEEFLRSSMFFGFDRQMFTIPFDCQPFRYLYPAEDLIEATNGGTITNPGTVYSAPKIAVGGSGDMQLTVGDQTIDITGGSVIIDSELEDCFEPDGVTLANSRVTLEEFPRLEPGETTISWSGGVARVYVEGRWRYL